MEEILASIRRIIADDDTAKPAAVQPVAAARVAATPPRPQVPPVQPAAPAPSTSMDQEEIDKMLAGLDAQKAEEAPAAEDVLDLTEQMAAPPESEAPSFQTIDGQTDVFFADAPADLRRA